MPGGRLRLRPLGPIVLRTPLLPADVLEQLGADLAVAGAGDDALEAAIAADRERIRVRMRELIARPEIREAIFVASPSLEASIDEWLAKPTSENGIKTERGLIRYLSRMAMRPTPFGLFAGNTVGSVGETTQLELGARASYRRYTRLDGDYLAKLTDMLGADPAIRTHLVYRPSTSLCRVAGGLRYAFRHEGEDRTYALVDLEVTDYLVATLERARDGATLATLAQALCDADPDVTREEADAYVGELVDAQVLESDLAPLVTGVEAVDDVIAQLAAIPEPAAQLAAKHLDHARSAMRTLDGGISNAPAAYRAIHESLQPLAVKAELGKMFQVNLVPIGSASLSRAVVDEAIRAIEVMRTWARANDPMRSFREAFTERYEDREVPLVEVLDEEAGIGFGRSTAPGADASPLLEGLPFRGGSDDPTVPWTQVQARMLRRIAEAVARGDRELVLDDADVKAMDSGAAPPYPDALAAKLELAGSEADWEVSVAAYGPSGGNLLGRFCHSDPALHACVTEQLAAEEAARPDVVFAEVVHLADGRLANISARPVLRGHEIVFLGRSGAPRERQLSVTDLMVSVRGDRVVLRSSSLDKEVVPRLTNAHNFSARSLGTYKFLASLQGQQGFSFDLGVLAHLPYVPRIKLGRVVLRAASWRLHRDQLEPIVKATGAARVRAMRALRATARLPRWVSLEEGDNVLPVDLDNITSLDSFLHQVKAQPVVALAEMWPAPDRMPVRGEGGRFANEIVLPLLRVRDDAQPEAAPRRRTAARVRGQFGPGAAWLYAKLYTGQASADQVLQQVIAPLAERLPSWFFIRYNDPHNHVRFRVRGEPAQLASEVLPALAAAYRPLLDDGRVWKVQLDTYEREVARYGGPVGIELAERLFHADSLAVVAMLGMLSGDAGSDARWRLALRGIDQLLGDLGLDLAGKHRVMSQARESFAREHRVHDFVPFQKTLGDRYRKERGALDALLDPANDEASELGPALACLAARSHANAPIVAELRDAEARGVLTVPIADLANSYIHMHVNRMLRSSQRAHELVLYDFLARLYESRIARAKPRGQSR